MSHIIVVSKKICIYEMQDNLKIIWVRLGSITVRFRGNK